jgi:hypothetical protein
MAYLVDLYYHFTYLFIRTNDISAAPYINEENKAELSDESDENVCISLCDHTIQSHGGLRGELGQHNETKVILLLWIIKKIIY